MDLIREDIKTMDGRGSPLTVVQQTVLALAYYANGSFQHTAGVILGTKKAHEIIHCVTKALCQRGKDFIALPRQAEMRELANDLMDRFGIPRVALGVDGTFIRLGNKPVATDLPPGLHLQDIWGRKQFYCFNVMVVGDSKQFIRKLSVGWAGSTHDAQVWRNSTTKI